MPNYLLLSMYLKVNLYIDLDPSFFSHSFHISALTLQRYEIDKQIEVKAGRREQVSTFTFDCVFPPGAEQDVVYDTTARPVIE
jgi:hypothetical protein